MQTKLSEEQMRQAILAKRRSEKLVGFLRCHNSEAYQTILEVDQAIAQMICHGTSDGKPCIEPEPPIPEGYRKANADEWRRMDVKYWSYSAGQWEMRLVQGSRFDPPGFRSVYIVPIDPPLTDEDACVWPRLLVMVRDADGDDWQGPLFLLSVNDSSWPFGVACKSKLWGGGWKQARRATPEEIEAAHGNS